MWRVQVHPTWQKTKPDDDSDPHWGWVFRPGATLSNKLGHGKLGYDDMCTEEHMYGLPSIRALYEKCNSGQNKYTVPVLWDKETQTIVNNESEELVRMLNSEFNAFAKNPELDLYPEALRPAIHAVRGSGACGRARVHRLDFQRLCGEGRVRAIADDATEPCE